MVSWGENRSLAPNGAKFGSLGFQPEDVDSHVFCALKGRGRSLRIGYDAIRFRTSS